MHKLQLIYNYGDLKLQLRAVGSKLLLHLLINGAVILWGVQNNRGTHHSFQFALSLVLQPLATALDPLLAGLASAFCTV